MSDNTNENPPVNEGNGPLYPRSQEDREWARIVEGLGRMLSDYSNEPPLPPIPDVLNFGLPPACPTSEPQFPGCGLFHVSAPPPPVPASPPKGTRPPDPQPILLRDLLAFLEEDEEIAEWHAANPAPPSMTLLQSSAHAQQIALATARTGPIHSRSQAREIRGYLELEDLSESTYGQPLSSNRCRTLLNRVAKEHGRTFAELLDMTVVEFSRLLERDAAAGTTPTVEAAPAGAPAAPSLHAGDAGEDSSEPQALTPKWSEMTESIQAIFIALRESKSPQTGLQVSEKAGYAYGTLRRYFASLQEAGLIRRSRHGYSLTEQGRAIIPETE